MQVTGNSANIWLACLDLNLNNLKGKESKYEDNSVFQNLLATYLESNRNRVKLFIFIILSLIAHPLHFPTCVVYQYVYHSVYHLKSASNLYCSTVTEDFQTNKKKNHFVWRVQMWCSSCSTVRCYREDNSSQ